MSIKLICVNKLPEEFDGPYDEMLTPEDLSDPDPVKSNTEDYIEVEVLKADKEFYKDLLKSKDVFKSKYK